MSDRIFVVGCSRSGTTMLQVCLAAHPAVHSFPETFFFEKATGRHGHWLARLGLPTGELRTSLWRVLAEIARPDLGHRIPPGPLGFARASRCFVDLLDQSTLDAGKRVWVEKTPMHVHRIDLIERHVPGAQFVHMLRDGRDVVASIVARARAFPERFGDQIDPAFGVERWNRAIEASARQLGRPRHHFVSYEGLTARPEVTLKGLFAALGLAPEPATSPPRGFATGEVAAAEEVVPEGRPWIHAARRAPSPRPSRFEETFDPPTRARILEGLRLGRYQALLARVS